MYRGKTNSFSDPPPLRRGCFFPLTFFFAFLSVSGFCVVPRITHIALQFLFTLIDACSLCLLFSCALKSWKNFQNQAIKT